MDEPRDCVLCDTAWGIVGALAALAILYVSADLLTGGRLTAAIFTREAVAGDGGD